MGNVPIGIGLKLDKTTYEAGSVVKGVVYLKIQPDSNVRVKSIGLILEGEERTTVTYTENENEANEAQHDHHHHHHHDFHHHHHHHSRRHSRHQQNAGCGDPSFGSTTLTGQNENNPGQRTITRVGRASTTLIRINVPLAQFFHVLPPGQYEYPFQWEIPQHLPASMQFNGSNESNCEIHYQVTAFYSTTTANRLTPFDANFSKRSAKQEIKILAHPAPVQSLRVLQDEEDFPISSCCCFRKGRVNLGFILDRNILSPGSSATVELLGKNLSQVNVQQLQVTLFEHIKWSADDHTEQVTNTLVKETVPTYNLPQWQAQKSRNHHTHEELLSQEVWIDAPKIRLNTPLRARNSYVGNLMEVTHSLEITACTPFHVTTPRIACSVQVGPVLGEDDRVTQPLASAPNHEYDTNFTSTPQTRPNSSIPLAQAEWILPEDWNGQTAEVIIIPPASVMVQGEEEEVAVTTAREQQEDQDFAFRPPPVAPSAPNDSLLSEFSTKPYNFDQITPPCDFDRLEAFLSTIHDLERLPYLLQQEPSTLARVQMLTPRQFVQLLHLSKSQQEQGLHGTSKECSDIARGRVLAATMGSAFQCRHVVACLWGCADHARLDILRELTPLASDWIAQRETVERELESDELDYIRTVLQM